MGARPTEDELSRAASLYIDGLSINAVAKEMGWWSGTTRSRLMKRGVRLRTVGEGVHLAKRAPPIQPSARLLEVMDGVLMGDGSIEDGEVGARLSLMQKEDRLPWIEQIASCLSEDDIAWSYIGQKGGAVTIRGRQYQRSPAKGLRTRSYPFLKEERRRWYLDGVKRIPDDLRLTPTMVLHWFSGDGLTAGNGYRMTFCTDGFPEEDVARLRLRMISAFGWKVHHTKRNRLMVCCVEDRVSLLTMLDGIAPCFSHKVKGIKTKHQRRALSSEQIKELISLRKDGWSYNKLAARFKMSKSSVCSLCLNGGYSHGHGAMAGRQDPDLPRAG